MLIAVCYRNICTVDRPTFGRLVKFAGKMGDGKEKSLAEMEDEDMKKELFRQYTKHNEELMGAVEEGVVRCKIVMVGAEGAGKTSFMNRLTKNQFTQAQSPTIGSAYFLQGVAIEDIEYNFDIWDVSGNVRYQSLVPMVSRCTPCLASKDAVIVSASIRSHENHEKVTLD